MTVSTEQRVAAGAAWLDERWPLWHNAIALDELDMSVCDRCVLGQVFGGFGLVVTSDGKQSASALTHIGMTFAEADSRGFSAYAEELIGGEAYEALSREEQDAMIAAASGEYDELNQLWRALITARRTGGA